MIRGLTTKRDYNLLNDFVNQNKYRELYPHYLWEHEDALIKWGGISYNIQKVVKPSDVILDAGYGDSPLPCILSPFAKTVIGVDIRREPYSKGPNSKRDNVIYVQQDCINFLRQTKSKTLNIIYDACSIIHFDIRSSKEIPNFGFNDVVKEASRCLTDDGWLFIISDCNADGEGGELFSFRKMKQIIDNHNFKLVGLHVLELQVDACARDFNGSNLNVVSFVCQK